MAKQKGTYFATLRALGSWLDDENPERFTIIETIGGFTAILTRTVSGRPDLTELQFDRETLIDRERRLVEKRRILGSAFGSIGQSHWSLAPTGRQDFLRALGYELDDTDASDIILDELEDQLILTYSYVNPAQGYLAHKRMVTLRPQEIANILEVARERRQREKKSRLRW